MLHPLGLPHARLGAALDVARGFLASDWQDPSEFKHWCGHRWLAWAAWQRYCGHAMHIRSVLCAATAGACPLFLLGAQSVPLPASHACTVQWEVCVRLLLHLLSAPSLAERCGGQDPPGKAAVGCWQLQLGFVPVIHGTASNNRNVPPKLILPLCSAT